MGVMSVENGAQESNEKQMEQLRKGQTMSSKEVGAEATCKRQLNGKRKHWEQFGSFESRGGFKRENRDFEVLRSDSITCAEKLRKVDSIVSKAVEVTIQCGRRGEARNQSRIEV